MAWILLHIIITTSGIEAIPIELYQDMTQCFQGREALLAQQGYDTEFFPINQQAICVRTDII